MNSYRKCAGAVVFNKAKKVLVCARNDTKGYAWQFPQGGIENSEAPQNAAIRELKEETSIISVKLVKSLSESIKYDFPDYVLKHGIGKVFVGQEMYWSLLFFYGSDNEINLNTNEPEFNAYEWVEPSEAVKRIVNFKKDVYEKVLAEFETIIRNY